MDVIKHIFSRYIAFLGALLKPLGVWGVFVIAALDGAALGLPMDPIVATYVYQNRARFLLYVLMASAGSALGSIVIYGIGYLGGEELLRKRISPERFERFHRAFEKHPFWSLMFPAMLPRPPPSNYLRSPPRSRRSSSATSCWPFLLGASCASSCFPSLL